MSKARYETRRQGGFAHYLIRISVVLVAVPVILNTGAWLRAGDEPAPNQEPRASQPEARDELPPNKWVALDLQKWYEQRWGHYDGYSDTVYRPDTGTVLIRTNLKRKELKDRNSGFYTNGTLEWNPRTNEVRFIEITNWHGGSSGRVKGYPLPAFDQHPTPVPRHTYDALAYVPEEKAMYTTMGAYSRIRTRISRVEDEEKRERAQRLLQQESQSTWKLDVETGEWERFEGSPKTLFPDVWMYEAHMAYWPEKNVLTFLGSAGKRYAHFDLGKKVWKKVPKQPTGFSIREFQRLWHMRSAWDSKRDAWVFRKSNKVVVFNPETAEMKKLPDPYEPRYNKEPEESPRVLPADSQGSICYISKHDVYMIPRVPGPWGNKTMVFHPDKGEWETVKGGDTLPVRKEKQRRYCHYDEKGDVVVFTFHHYAAVFKYVP